MPASNVYRLQVHLPAPLGDRLAACQRQLNEAGAAVSLAALVRDLLTEAMDARDAAAGVVPPPRPREPRAVPVPGKPLLVRFE